ncbi:MAG: Ig-like domain-containing protein [Gemmatimonadota bacterium]
MNPVTRLPALLICLAFAACGETPVDVVPPDTNPPPAPASLDITPATTSFDAFGQSTSLSAAGQDAAGTALANASLTWTSSDPTIVQVDASGTVTAVGNGTATITGSHADVSATAEVTVLQVVALVDLQSPPAMSAGSTHQMVALALDAGDSEVVGATFAWASEDPAIATVDASGLVTAVADGTAAVTAIATDLGGIEASASEDVTAATASQVTEFTLFLTTGGASFQSGTWAINQNNFGRRISVVGSGHRIRVLNDTLYYGSGIRVSRMTLTGNNAGFVPNTDQGNWNGFAVHPEGIVLLDGADDDMTFLDRAGNVLGSAAFPETSSNTQDMYGVWDGTQMRIAQTGQRKLMNADVSARTVSLGEDLYDHVRAPGPIGYANGNTYVAYNEKLYEVDSAGVVTELFAAPNGPGEFVDLVVVGNHIYSIHDGTGVLYQTDLATGLTTNFRENLVSPSGLTAIERQIVP